MAGWFAQLPVPCPLTPPGLRILDGYKGMRVHVGKRRYQVLLFLCEQFLLYKHEVTMYVGSTGVQYRCS
jgi:hypothetical protein